MNLIETSDTSSHEQMSGCQFLLMAAVFLLSLAARAYLLDERWINPDEGAHLMDAMLMLEGKIPLVEFHSRQPVYVLVNAFALHLFGANIFAGRLLPLFCSLLTGWVIFFIARRVYSGRDATFAAILFWLLPLEMMNSVVVKTEPLNMLIMSAAAYCMIRGFQSFSWAYWGLSGALAAVAYYVRQSALVLPFAACLLFLFGYFGRKSVGIREMLSFFAGFSLVVMLVLSYYSKFFTWGELIEGGLNPAGFLFKAGMKALGVNGETTGGSLFSRAVEQSGGNRPSYFRYAKSAVLMHLCLIAGVVLAGIGSAKASFRPKHVMDAAPSGVAVLYLWLFGLLLSYGYYFIDRGFYIDYAREFTPPLVILFAGWFLGMFGQGAGRARWAFMFLIVALPAAAAGALWAPTYSVFPKPLLPAAVCFCTFCAYLGWERLARGRKLKSDPLSGDADGSIRKAAMQKAPGGLDAGYWKRAVCLSLIASSLSLSLVHSAPVIDRSYDSIWSPQLLEEVSGLIKSHSAVNDQVMSGGLIWEFEAGRHPFLMISHPLIYIHGMDVSDKQQVERTLRDSPPKVIVKDGYTEKTYFRHFPWIPELLKQRYSVFHGAGPSRYPVSVYFRIDE
jgi:4-amino-4-deoxy-L-arabinose transferase-like glycosyltransferase